MSAHRPRAAQDLLQQGLGFTLTFWVSALLVAVRNGRVLIEVPVDNTWPPPPRGASPNRSRAVLGTGTPRWCGVPPYTLQCFYADWSHCQAPQNISMHTAPQTRHTRRAPVRLSICLQLFGSITLIVDALSSHTVHYRTHWH